MIKSAIYAVALILVGVEVARRWPNIPQPSALFSSGRAKAITAQTEAQRSAVVAKKTVAAVQDELEAQRQAIQKRLDEVSMPAGAQG